MLVHLTSDDWLSNYDSDDNDDRRWVNSDDARDIRERLFKNSGQKEI